MGAKAPGWGHSQNKEWVHGQEMAGSLYENSAHGDKYLQNTKEIIRSGFFQFGEWHINYLVWDAINAIRPEL